MADGPVVAPRRPLSTSDSSSLYGSSFPPITVDQIEEAREQGRNNLALDPIVAPGLKKFVTHMERFRNSSNPEDRAAFTRTMKAETFEEANQRYDAMIGEIHDKTVRSTINSSSAHLEGRINHLERRLQKLQIELEELPERSSNNNNNNSNQRYGRYSRPRNNVDVRKIRLENSITSTRKILHRLEGQFERRQEAEADGHVLNDNASTIQRQMFEKYERAGYIDRTHLPNPSNNINELNEAIANPISYERNHMPLAERTARLEARREAHKQMMAEQEAAKREAAKQNAIDMARSAFERSKSARGTDAYRASREFSLAPRWAKDAVLNEHFAANPVAPTSTYRVSAAVARDTARSPGKMNFLANAGTLGEQELAATRRSLSESGDTELLRRVVERTIDPAKVEAEYKQTLASIPQNGPESGMFHKRIVDRMIADPKTDSPWANDKEVLSQWSERYDEIRKKIASYHALSGRINELDKQLNFNDTYELGRVRNWLLQNSQSRQEPGGNFVLSELPKNEHFPRVYQLLNPDAKPEEYAAPSSEPARTTAQSKGSELYNDITKIAAGRSITDASVDLSEVSRQIAMLSHIEKARLFADIGRAYKNAEQMKLGAQTTEILDWMKQQVDDPRTIAINAYYQLNAARNRAAQEQALLALRKLSFEEKQYIHRLTENSIRIRTDKNVNKETLHLMADELELTLAA